MGEINEGVARNATYGTACGSTAITSADELSDLPWPLRPNHHRNRWHHKRGAFQLVSTYPRPSELKVRMGVRAFRLAKLVNHPSCDPVGERGTV